MSSKKKTLLPVVYILAVVAAVAVGVGVYTMKKGASSIETQMSDVNQAQERAVDAINEAGKGETIQQAAADDAQTAQNEPAAGESSAPLAGTVEGKEVRPGNPVVAKVDEQPITRVDVFRYIQGMPQQIQQLPPASVYPLALDQVIDTRLIQNKAEAANLDDDPAFKEQMSLARQQIARAVFIQREVDKRISEDDMKSKYKEMLKAMGKVEERRARHILVDSEDKANEVLKKLNEGADFAALVKEYSKGPSVDNGGELGWFSKQDMVPAFADVAFATKPGSVNPVPVKTQFGWHVVEVEETRTRPDPTFEEMAPMIQAELRRDMVDTLVKDWRKDAEIQVYDINGDPLNETAPAAGDDSAADQPASKE